MKLMIHGGAGRAIRDPSRARAVREALHSITHELWEVLTDGASAREVVRRGCELLESDPNFNAGTGSVLQDDGQVRMSASVMQALPDTPPSFSGVINATRIEHPIRLADMLQEERDRVLDGAGVADLARILGLPIYDPVTPKRLREWIAEREEAVSKEMANVVGEDRGTGTIGVVVLDGDGALCAGTSTGGRGFERVGRVSDSAMPSGNYANHAAAVSCTGIGEDITDECLGAKIAIRVTDGASLHEALERSFGEAHAHKRTLGAIAVDKAGHLGWGKTSDILLAAYHDGDQVHDTLDLPPGLFVQGAGMGLR